MKTARLCAGLSQPEMARRIGISVALLADFESGRSRPSERIAVLLQNAFDEPVEGLLSEIRVVSGLPTVRDRQHDGAIAQ